MPEGVPPAISASFDSIIPMVVSLAIFYPISLMVQNFSDGKLTGCYNDLVSTCHVRLDSLLGIIFITGIAQVFWFWITWSQYNSICAFTFYESIHCFQCFSL